MLKTLTQFISRFKYCISLTIYLYLIIILQASPHINIVTIFSIFSVLVLMKLFSQINKYLSFIFLFFSSIIITLQAVYSFAYNTQVGYSEVEVIALTNITEANGMMKENLVCILCCIVISFFLVFKSNKELLNLKLKLKDYLYFFGFYILATGLFLGYKLKEDKDFHAHDIVRSTSFFIYYFLRTTNPIIYTPTYSAFLYHSDVKRFERIKNLPKITQDGISLADTTKQIPKRIFIVLGESLTRRNMSLYGYKEQKTTPFLENLSDSILNYYPAISAANFTNRAIPLAITSSSIHSLNDYFTTKTSIELAKDRNIGTYWISNQPKTDLFNTQSLGNAPVNIGSTTDHSYFASNEEHLDDLKLINEYLKIRNRTKDNNSLIFFHLRGSHQPYNEGSDELDKLDSNSSLKSYEIDYNKTVRHTDRFMEKLYNIMDLETDILIMISDHGEEVGFGHFSQRLLKTQYDVPLLIINNKDRDYITFLNQFRAEDGLISTSSLYYLIVHVLGYQIDPKLIQETRDNTHVVLNSGIIGDYRDFE